MEGVVNSMQLNSVYTGKKVFITGHTGFKGSWLTAFLQQLGAHVTGYSLAPVTEPAHFSLLKSPVSSHIEDIRNGEKLTELMQDSRPDIIFHLAAQPLVRESYSDPVTTYTTNVIGTLNVLEAAKQCNTVKAIVCITTDKVYENLEQDYAYVESDRLGGYDMYSSSKACCELLISSYRNSFFNLQDYGDKHEVLLASARAGNVIGGGDWSKDRLIPDMMKAAAGGNKAIIRNPDAIRPWQHVLDCLYGYLLLGGKLLDKQKAFARAWNFSPFQNDLKKVSEVIDIAKESWAEVQTEVNRPAGDLHEATLLQLDNTMAVSELQWYPVWDTAAAIARTVEWYKAYYERTALVTNLQLTEYLTTLNDRK